jgi:hypothetical protein
MEKSVKNQIFAELNNALDNGYSSVVYDSLNIVADDLLEHSQYVEELNIEHNELEKIIFEWQQQIKNT